MKSPACHTQANALDESSRHRYVLEFRFRSETQSFKNPKQHFCDDHWEENSDKVWKDSRVIWGRSIVLKFWLKTILDYIQHLNFDLSRSLKVKCDGGFRLPTYDFLLVFNLYMAISAALPDISLWYLSDLDIDLSRSNEKVSLDSSYMLSY